MSEDFKFRLNFVIPEDLEWPELSDGCFTSMTEDQIAVRSLSSLDAWIVQPYQFFLARGLNVSHSRTPRVGCINVAGGFYLGSKARGLFPFVVVCQADSHPSMIGNFVIRQNGCLPETSCTSSLPHPLQPALKQRNSDRNGLKTLVFKGRAQNLERSLQSASFAMQLNEIGVEFRIDDNTTNDRLWSDYRSADAVVAMRNLTSGDALTKPAHKLINAWRAGVPALLGPEPAYRELRRSELDYIEVRSPAEVISAVKKLANNDILFQQMTENGDQRAEEYSESAVYRKWIELFNGPIAEEFEKWQTTPKALKVLRFLRTSALERRSKRIAKKYRSQGGRILDA